MTLTRRSRAPLKLYESGGKFCGQVYEAIESFAAANTDALHVQPHFELVLICGAFERLVGCTDGTANALLAAYKPIWFREELPVSQQISYQRIVKESLRGYPTRSAWLKDMYILRNEHAHGKHSPQYKSTWRLDEHLLLASHIFPIVLKCALSKSDAYAMTPDDKRDVFAIDYLLHLNDQLAPVAADEPHEFAWTEALKTASWDHLSPESKLAEMLSTDWADATEGEGGWSTPEIK
jgi:hypothetical protein